MRLIKSFNVSLLAVVAFGAMAVATARAEEKEPAGVLFLPGESGPVSTSGELTGLVSFRTLGLKSVVLQCSKLRYTAETSASELSHATLGSAAIDFEGCKLGKISCSSENMAGEKDPKETILLVPEDTDGHAVSLLNGTKLLAGFLAGFLELAKEGKKRDATANCGGVKILKLGAQFFAALGVSATEDITKGEIIPTLLTCDANDELCKKLLASWGTTATFKNGEKDEKRLCPLAIFIEVEEECIELSTEKPVPVTSSKMGLIDF